MIEPRRDKPGAPASERTKKKNLDEKLLEKQKMSSVAATVSSYTSGLEEGTFIICDCCNQAKFETRLYACLQCVDVDLCQECYASGTPFGNHQRTHTCVWQRTGQNSFSCSCGERHIIRTLFQEHFASERHQNWASGSSSAPQSSANSSSDATDSHVLGTSSPSTPTASSAPTESAMDRRARVNELLGTYHPSNQSSNVPTTNSYSSLRRTSGDYLNPGPVAERRLSAISNGDDASPSSRSPSRYNPENSNYAQRRARLGLDNNDDSLTTTSYSATRRARLGLDNDDDASSSYSSRRSRLGLDTDNSSGTDYSSRYARQRSERESTASDISRMSRNLERSVSSILSGDYRRGAESRSFIEDYENDRRARNGLSRSGNADESSISRTSRFGLDEMETEAAQNGGSSLSKEEEEMAAKKLGWVDEKEAEKRIGTGWYEKEKQSQDAKKAAQEKIEAEEEIDFEEEIELSPEEIVSRMNNVNLNEFGRDPDKGDVVFLAQCQCFRAESEMIKKQSSKLAKLVDEHRGDEFIPLECSAVILDHLLNSFYSLSSLKLETIECLMLLHASEKYECRRTRDWCVDQIKKTLSSKDGMALLVALDIVARYCQNPPAQLDNLVASCVNYLISNNAFGRIEGIKQFHPKIFGMDESVLTQLAIGVAEHGSGDSIVEFSKILNLWAGEQRESSRGAQLKDILQCLRIEDKLNSTQISKIIQFQHFHENFEPLQFLSLAIAKVILTKHK